MMLPDELWCMIFKPLIWHGMAIPLELTCKQFYNIMTKLVRPEPILLQNTIFLAGKHNYTKLVSWALENGCREAANVKLLVLSGQMDYIDIITPKSAWEQIAIVIQSTENAYDFSTTKYSSMRGFVYIAVLLWLIWIRNKKEIAQASVVLIIILITTLQIWIQ